MKDWKCKLFGCKWEKMVIDKSISVMFVGVKMIAMESNCLECCICKEVLCKCKRCKQIKCGCGIG